MPKTYLMVGGEHAGQRLELEYEVDSIDLPKRRELSARFDIIEEPRAIPRSEAFETYRREVIGCRRDHFVVYCLEGANLIGELLQGYHPIIKRA